MNLIKNAVIEYARIEIEDHGLLTAFIGLDYGDSGHQGFGGYGLFSPTYPKKSTCGYFIYNCLKVVGVDDWAKMVGKTLRVEIDKNGFDYKILRIGHITKDIWFCPSEELKMFDDD